MVRALFKDVPLQRCLAIWLLIVLIVFLIHCVTLTISPPMWQDEVQIIDYGRIAIDPTSDWSVNWNVRRNAPIPLINYIGPLIQELAFQVSGYSIAGPRLLSITGGIVASTILLIWLVSIGLNKLSALVLSVLFLLDPLFVQSYRGDRVDAWAMAFCFASMIGLQCFKISCFSAGNVLKWIILGVSGGAAATAFIIWPSAAVLFPLILWRFLVVTNFLEDYKKGLIYLLMFALGGVVVAGILLAPMLDYLMQAAKFLLGLTERSLPGQDGIGHVLAKRIGDLVVSFRLSPFIPLAALGVLVFLRERGLLIVTIVAIVIVIATGPYTHRVIYLLPYFIVALGSMLRPEKLRGKLLSTRFIYSILGLQLVWAVGLSLAARPALALTQREQRNPDIVKDVAVALIGRGSKSVLLGPWEFYFAGRELGWHMYGPMLLEYNDQGYRLLLSRMDAVIVGENHKNALLVREVFEKTGQCERRSLESIHYGPYLICTKR